MKRLRIATRESRLALWQAEEVARLVRLSHPGVECELVRMTTKGDRFLEAPLGTIGGKGLFIKELEQALMDGGADIAVHSMKDMTVDLPAGLALPVIMARGNPLDAFVSPEGWGIDGAPEGARIGSSSLRRQCQLRSRRPDLDVVSIRGNVDTRLSKLDSGHFDALVLASAGLERLQLAGRIAEVVPAQVMLPAIGQGAMGIECRENDSEVLKLIEPLGDPRTTVAVLAERALNEALGGGCHVPVAGFAEVERGRVLLRGLVGRVDGTELLHAEDSDVSQNAVVLGRRVAARLKAKGAEAILASVGETGES